VRCHQQVRLVGNLTAENQFLDIAAGKIFRLNIDGRRRHLKILDQLLGMRLDSTVGEKSSPGKLFLVVLFEDRIFV
jgi:hypothetical protein